MTLEERITRLEDIEAIRYLQAKYQRCLDSRDFDNLANCFHEDAVSSYDSGEMTYKGRDAIIKFLCSVMKLNMPSSHLIHGGEIDIIDETHAKAKWILEDHLLHQTALVKIHGAAIYSIEYVKVDGNWLIMSIGYKRYYEYFEFRGLLNLLTLSKKHVFEDVKNAKPETLGEYGKHFRYNVLKRKK